MLELFWPPCGDGELRWYDQGNDIQKCHLGGGHEAPRSRAEGAEGVGRGRPPPQKIFQYCIIKWPVLVDSDVLHVLLIVVVKLETCT